eukprot:TRINITY_DN1913_c0_g1_i1.p1 TRINITY_DN1913_c0_g1~~TRINITY_DN1913_c0_g1_i1.p1  ORF type:complete len:121 (-),score=18.50 TRINITY_DN1913_c0_g1_i1:512-874(-)
MDIGYCISIYKAQGCTFNRPHCIWGIEDITYRETNEKMRLMYVAMTRAKHLKQIKMASLKELPEFIERFEQGEQQQLYNANDIKKMKVVQLRELAKQVGVKNIRKYRKAELTKLIIENLQ